MEVSPGDLIDRFSIVKLKMENVDRNFFAKEFQELEEEINSINISKKLKQQWVSDFYHINSQIWLLESRIEKLADDWNLEEIGRTALRIRRLNNQRTRMKNKIAKECGIGFLDKKRFYFRKRLPF